MPLQSALHGTAEQRVALLALLPPHSVPVRRKACTSGADKTLCACTLVRRLVG